MMAIHDKDRDYHLVDKYAEDLLPFRGFLIYMQRILFYN